MKINKKVIIITILLVGFVFFLIFSTAMSGQISRNKCYNLDYTKRNFKEIVDKCYVSAVIDKERKDYLIEEYQKQAIKNRKIIIDDDKIIEFNKISITPQETQYILYLDSDYCNDEHNYCNGCILNFINSRYPEDKTIIFSQESKNSGMNFIDKANISVLDEDFCFKLDCGDYESYDICSTKNSINKRY